MKIRQALETIKNLKPSQYSDEMLVNWLSVLDAHVWEDLLRRRGVPAPAVPYNRNALEREMLIPFPHDQIYLTWMGAQIDLMNAEYERYNNQMMLYNAQLQEYANEVTRTMQVTDAVIVKGVRAL